MFFRLPSVEKTCAFCGKVFSLPGKMWNKHIREGYAEDRVFCSRNCAVVERNKSDAMRAAISKKQTGVSVPSRGRVGHAVSDEAKEKIRQSKVGVPHRQDYDIVVGEMARRGITQYVTLTKRPIPDAVFIEDGKLVAVEVEKERWQAGINNKMKEYAEHPNKWSKVILVWYSPEGQRMKEWILQGGVWKED
jgi:hypothetical protein